MNSRECQLFDIMGLTSSTQGGGIHPYIHQHGLTRDKKNDFFSSAPCWPRSIGAMMYVFTNKYRHGVDAKLQRRGDQDMLVSFEDHPRLLVTPSERKMPRLWSAATAGTYLSGGKVANASFGPFHWPRTRF